MSKSNVINIVKDKFFSDESAPEIKHLRVNDKRIDNGLEVNQKVIVIAKDANEKCTKDSYVFNFDPDSMVRYKELGCSKDVIFALRCANDDRFCVLGLDEVLCLQQQREAAQQLDETKQLSIKIEITNRKGFSAYVNGGGKLNPVGEIKRSTGLLTQWVRKMISR